MPGHFEVYPRRFTDYGGDPEEVSDGHPDDLRVGPPTGDYGWRFIDQHGKTTAHSEDGFDTPKEAKRQVALFVGQVRQATYGQRFDAELADAVIEVDL